MVPLPLSFPLLPTPSDHVSPPDSANATLAIGASPIMATVPSEVTQLSRIIGGLLVNFGTIKDIDGMLAAGKAANANGKPVVFDPVAAGASDLRKTSADGVSVLSVALLLLATHLFVHEQSSSAPGNRPSSKATPARSVPSSARTRSNLAGSILPALDSRTRRTSSSDSLGRSDAWW